MPGGMVGGIAGSLMNMLTKGMRRGTGGMGGMGSMGGMGMQQQTAATTEQTSVYEYDINRWQRTDEQQTAVQQVRNKWAEEQEKKQQKKLSYKIKHLFKKKKKQATEHVVFEDIQPATGGTIDLRPRQPISAPTANVQTRMLEQRATFRRDMEASSSLRQVSSGFFQENPLNSTWLAMDDLSLGPLALNQVQAIPPWLSPPGERARRLASQVDASLSGTTEDVDANLPMHRVPLNVEYMDTFHAKREARKYDVKML